MRTPELKLYDKIAQLMPTINRPNKTDYADIIEGLVAAIEKAKAKLYFQVIENQYPPEQIVTSDLLQQLTKLGASLTVSLQSALIEDQALPFLLETRYQSKIFDKYLKISSAFRDLRIDFLGNSRMRFNDARPIVKAPRFEIMLQIIDELIIDTEALNKTFSKQIDYQLKIFMDNLIEDVLSPKLQLVFAEKNLLLKELLIKTQYHSTAFKEQLENKSSPSNPVVDTLNITPVSLPILDPAPPVNVIRKFEKVIRPFIPFLFQSNPHLSKEDIKPSVAPASKP